MTVEGERPARRYPAAPVVGVSGVVVHEVRVLLIERGREPLKGRWSLPGGALELGETLAEGVVREVLEETGVRVRPVEMIATLDRIVRDDAGAVQFHYVLVDFVCVPEGDELEPRAGDDASEARWVETSELDAGGYNLEAATVAVIHRALKHLETLT